MARPRRAISGKSISQSAKASTDPSGCLYVLSGGLIFMAGMLLLALPLRFPFFVPPLAILAFGVGGLVLARKAKIGFKTRQQQRSADESHSLHGEADVGQAASDLVPPRITSAPRADAAEALSDFADDEEDDLAFISPRVEPGPVTLRPDGTPLKTFIVVLIFAAFWNSIVSVFVFQVFRGFQAGAPEFFLALFLTPFVLIGVVLLFAAGHTFLSIFNPRPALTLLNGDIALGEQLELRWQFSGNTSAMRHLRIELKGTEKATYRRGTSTYTDRHVFAELPIVDTSHAVDMTSGSGSMRIPLETMHSFKTRRNEIEWTLRVHGSIAYWPDVDVSFPLTIHPAALPAA